MTIRSRILDVLGKSFKPLYAAEIASQLGHDYTKTVDALGVLYREGRVAKSSRYRGDRPLFAAPERAYMLPWSAEPHLMERKVREPVERPREPTKVDVHAVARMRSIFEWRP